MRDARRQLSPNPPQHVSSAAPIISDPVFQTPSLDPLTSLRALKGAPLSCLMAMLLAGQPVSARWLAAVTGYGKNTITMAMTTLEQLHYAARDTNRSAWRLAETAQMALPFEGVAMASPKNWDTAPNAEATIIPAAAAICWIAFNERLPRMDLGVWLFISRIRLRSS